MVDVGDGLSILAIALGVTGTFLIAFGLKIRGGTTPELRRKWRLKDGEGMSSDVEQRTTLTRLGLALIVFAGAIQVVVILMGNRLG